jgi:predicted Zn-dependent peptidase
MAVDRSRLPALGPDPAFTFPEFRRHDGPNQVRVWTVEHREVPLISVLVLLPVGSAADPPERPGLAAMTGDLLDEGSGDLNALEVHEALARIGAQLDTEVGSDATLLDLTVLERHAARGLELMADMVLRPRFEQRDFDRVRDLRLNRLVQLRDVPSALADRVFAELLFKGHPYGHLPIGTEGSLRALTLREVSAFHARAYRPEQTTIVAVGDASHDQLAALVRSAFAGWKVSDGPAPRLASGPVAGAADSSPSAAARLAIVNRAAAAQSELRIGHVGPSRSTDDYHALLVLNMVLGGQFVSRINMNLREDKGYTYGARTSFDFRRLPGAFSLQVSVQSEATADAIREAIGELRAIRGDRPVTRDELELGRAALTRGYPRNFETADQVGRAAVQLALYDLPEDYFTTFVPKVLALTENDITRAAAAHLDPARLLTVVVGDREKVGASLQRLDLGEASEIVVA